MTLLMTKHHELKAIGMKPKWDQVKSLLLDTLQDNNLRIWLMQHSDIDSLEDCIGKLLTYDKELNRTTPIKKEKPVEKPVEAIVETALVVETSAKPRSFTGEGRTCFYCKKIGHSKQQCRSRIRDEANKSAIFRTQVDFV